MNISFFTLGCKLNTAETDELKRDLHELDFNIVPFNSHEDVAIVRGCGVTLHATTHTRQIIKNLKKRGILVIATGCVEETKLPEITFFAKNNLEVIKYLNKITNKFKTKQTLVENDLDRTRAFIKIQTGCNYNCAYCIIPHFRGKNLAISPKQIIEQINWAEKNGYQEVVLTGVNICQYQYHKNIKTLKHKNILLSDLLQLILEKTKISRIRLGSLDPRLITTELINLYRSQLEINNWKFGIRLLPHWHLSLQSGSDNILKQMNRHYTAAKYLEIIKQMRKIYPLFSFTTDIIVGFPGETEKDFELSKKIIKQAGFAKVHVFPFSPRPGTPAALMGNQIPEIIKKERVQTLLKLSDEIGQKFANKFIGKTRPVLFEHQTETNYASGYTPEYIRVKIKTKVDRYNQIEPIKISKTNLTL